MNQGGLGWLIYALLTVTCWGLYGNFLHSGQLGMADPIHGRYKAYLFVGVAYFLVAVLAPLALMLFSGAEWSFPARGMTISLIAGMLGAVGAFGILLAFGAKGTPAAVMSIVFAGAPIVNAVASMTLHPPAGGLGGVRWQFFAGIAIAAMGGFLVTFYKPNPAPPKPAVTQAAPPSAAPGGLHTGPGR